MIAIILPNMKARYFPPPGGRSAASFPEQRLVTEPTKYGISCGGSFYFRRDSWKHLQTVES